MATFTEHYSFIKPSLDDYYNIADFNENMDAVDMQMAEMETDVARVETNVNEVGDKVDTVGGKVEGVRDLIGTPADTGEDTLFGKLKDSYKKVYVPSETPRRTIENITIISSPTTTSNSMKMLNFSTKWSGAIRLKIQTTGVSPQTTCRINIYEALDLVAPNNPWLLPDLSFASSSQMSLVGERNLRDGNASETLYFNVIEGKHYSIFLHGSVATSFVCKKLQLCYDTIPVENAKEYPNGIPS